MFKLEDGNLSINRLDELKNKYESESSNTIVRHALSKNKISEICYNDQADRDTKNMFSIDIETMPVCNQKQSGRCWIFAGLNVLREIIGKKLNVSNFELSQNYVAFFDKLEKVNYALSSIMELVDKDHDDRVLMHILKSGIGDGGQWDMFVNIIKKYGFVPKTAMGETFQSSATMESDAILNATIRRFASEIKILHNLNKDEEIIKLKDEYMQKVYNFLTNCFGVPPTKFDLEYVTKDNVYHLVQNLSPIDFFEKTVGDIIDDYQSIINAPTSDKPYNKTFTIQYLNNVVEGKKIIHLNLPMERIEELIIKQLSNGELVWFGSDVSSYRNREEGIWDTLAYDYQSSLKLDIRFDKKEMLDYFASAMNHAMVITGVNLVNNIPTKWKIENSWGSDVGNKGYYIMSEDFFKTYVYQAVINKKYLNEEELKALKEEPILLKPWDPMGTLAD